MWQSLMSQYWLDSDFFCVIDWLWNKAILIVTEISVWRCVSTRFGLAYSLKTQGPVGPSNVQGRLMYGNVN
jgi:hypothetical protein